MRIRSYAKCVAKWGMITLFGLSIFAAQAQAQTDRKTYMGSKISYNIADENNLTFEDGIGKSIYIGETLWHQIRIEFEFTRRNTEITHISDTEVVGSVRTDASMINLYYDFDGSVGNLQPFFGGGIGVTKLKSKASGMVGTMPVYTKGNYSRPTMQATFGVTYDFVDWVTFEAGATLFRTKRKYHYGEFGNNTRFQGNYRTWSGFFGMRRSF